LRPKIRNDKPNAARKENSRAPIMIIFTIFLLTDPVRKNGQKMEAQVINTITIRR
jgi:hypothetical protein